MSKALTDYLNKFIGNYNVKIAQNEAKQGEVIQILKTTKTLQNNSNNAVISHNKQYKVIVKLYMTKKDSVNFTFHTTWNNGNPMPLRVMYGEILQETKNMYKMSLVGKITHTDYCLKCGKPLTNEISKLYGLGPECGQHYYINPLSKEEFENCKQSIQNKFDEIKWEGWIPKVAVISMEEINGNFKA